MPDGTSPQPSPAVPDATSRGPRRRGRGLRWLVLLVLIAASGAGWYWFEPVAGKPADWLSFIGGKPAAQAAPAPPPPSVTVSQPVDREVVEWDEFTGQFTPVEQVELRARVSGYLTEIRFHDGQIVHKGDLLFVIDPRPFEIALASAKAQLLQATSKLDLANAQLGRAGQLRQRDFVAAATYDERMADLRVAQSAVEVIKATIRSAELDLDFTRIAAPVTGRISRHEVSVGNLVTGGNTGNTTLLTTIVSLDPIQFTFDMSEADYLTYQRGVAQGRLKSTRDGSVPVFVRLTDETGWPHQGHIDFVDNRIDRGAGTIRVRAEVPNPDFFITAGQFGRLRLPGSEPHRTLMVPDSAIVTDQSRKILLTVAADGTVVPKPIKPGPVIDGLRVIRSGIEPGDSVIINGLMRARPGVKVTPQPGTIEAPPQKAG